MSKKKAPRTSSNMPTVLDQARDELFSHILRCGVLEAAPEHQKEWMDDTMQYIADRYPNMGKDELGQVRTLGERFCRPVVKHASAAETAESVPADVESEATEQETADVG
jgi:hypothetical protein